MEFGYETAGRSFSELRREWIATGARWASRVCPTPDGWNPWMQLIEAGYSMFVPWQTQISVQLSQPVRGQTTISHSPVYVIEAI